MPSYETVPDHDLADALRRIIQAGAPSLSREGDCFLATICATHVARSLAIAGFIVLRRDDQPRLDV